jgi:hypothetical protein
VWVLEDWWPTIRYLTLCWEFCSVQHPKSQYWRWNKFRYGINDEKGKSREDFIELRILYFIWVLGAPYYQGGTLGELVKCKTSKIYRTTKNSYQARHIRPPSWIPETLAGHVWPLSLIRLSSWVLVTLAGHVWHPARTCPIEPNSSATKSRTGHIRSLSRISEAFPRHVWPPARTCLT